MADNGPIASGIYEHELLEALERGPLHRFADWRSASVPRIAAGVYTIWSDNGQFTYVGMSGRALTEQDIDAPDEPAKARGLWTRLSSHASGWRSGDQFCVYICDRFVVPTLTAEQQSQIGDGVLSLDALTRTYIHDHLAYRYITLPNGKHAFTMERDVQRGALSAGKPLLNPL
jgi:hypothetical protein